jgi:hypothetical protein
VGRVTRLAEGLIQSRLFRAYIVLFLAAGAVSVFGSDPAWLLGLGALAMVPLYLWLAVMIGRWAGPWAAAMLGWTAALHVYNGVGFLANGADPRVPWPVLVVGVALIAAALVDFRRRRAGS